MSKQFLNILNEHNDMWPNEKGHTCAQCRVFSCVCGPPMLSLYVDRLCGLPMWTTCVGRICGPPISCVLLV